MTPDIRRLHKTLLFGARYGLHSASDMEIESYTRAMEQVLVSGSILIIGEAGDRPWIEGPTSQRLWMWFGCDTYEKFSKLARLENVYPRYGQKHVELLSDLEHIERLHLAADYAGLVFLVGRVAQRTICPLSNLSRADVIWREGKYVALPHPSGLNRQLNNIDNRLVQEFVKGVLRAYYDRVYS